MEQHHVWALQSVLTIVLILLSIYLIFSLHTTNESVAYIRKSISSTKNSPTVDEKSIPIPQPQSVNSDHTILPFHIPSSINEGTSGRLFQGEKVHTYNGRVLFRDLNASGIDALYHLNAVVAPAYSQNLTCTNWAVVTTINEPTEAVEKQISLPNWCVVVVGDKKGPFTYNIPSQSPNYVFLSAKIQEELSENYPIIRSLPWNHFGRKNIGYLYAIHNHARIIYDFDDDNILINKHFFHQFHHVLSGSNRGSEHSSSNNAMKCQVPVNCTDFILNPYPILGARQHPIWPRGYPLEYIRSTYYQPVVENHNHTLHSNANKKHDPTSPSSSPVLHLKMQDISYEDIGIIQLLANHDPDVDAIYRMTLPLPYNFPLEGYPPLLLPKPMHSLPTSHAMYAPYNAQATLHFYSAFWSLYLPISVHGRVSDIWRSYFTQRLIQDFPDSIQLLFSSPNVIQERNAHHYLADFNSEIPLYQQSLRLVEQLQRLQLCSATLPGRMEELYLFLYEHGYIEMEDVEMLQRWIESLVAVQYVFPTLPGNWAGQENCQKNKNDK